MVIMIIRYDSIMSFPAGLTGDRHQLLTGHQFITSLSPVVHANLYGKKTRDNWIKSHQFVTS